MTRLLAFALSIFLACAATAQESAETAIEGVIQGQIDAFQQDDFATAFDFASPSIKEIFGDVDTFGRMVRESYPMVWHPSDVQFGELREENGMLWQRVIVTDGAGTAHELDYQMIETADGWQINGVFLLRAQGVGV
jgi:hypothetical protein